MGNQQPSSQRSVSGNDISELASGLSQIAMALQSQNQAAQPKAKAMPKAKVAAQPPVPPPKNNNQEEAQGQEGGFPPVPPFPPFPPGLEAVSPVYPPGHGQLQDQFLRQCRFCKQVACWREGICVNEWCRVTWLQLVECLVCFVSLLIF